MKVSIIGSGMVGSTCAYALMMHRLASNIVLIDMDRERALAEAADIQHAAPYVHPVNITGGDYPDLDGSDILVITAGVSQKPGETRLELLGRNALILKDIVSRALYYAGEAIIIVATNPVDVITHLVASYASEYGVDPTRVIGTGTTLDTARFRALLGDFLGVDPQHVHGYVVGEHGDSEVLTWSIVDIGGLPLEDYAKFAGKEMDEQVKARIDSNVRGAAYKIIKGKGSTYYGISAAIARIVDVIAHDHRSILTVCTPDKKVAGIPDVTVSLPRLVGGKGILRTLPLRLSLDEESALEQSVCGIKTVLDSLVH